MELETAQRSDAAAEFVTRFAATWADPSVDRLLALLHEDVVLEQPVFPRAAGHDEAREAFKRILGGFPGLHGEVLGWSGDAGRLFIELRLRIPHPRPLDWTVVDVIRLEDGLVRYRGTFGDSLPLVLGILRRPALWGPLARNRPRFG